jgi:hypothetical protein
LASSQTILYSVGMNSLTLRPVGQDDLDFLWDFLAIDAYERDAEQPLNRLIETAERVGLQAIGPRSISTRIGTSSMSLGAYYNVVTPQYGAKWQIQPWSP